MDSDNNPGGILTTQGQPASDATLNKLGKLNLAHEDGIQDVQTSATSTGEECYITPESPGIVQEVEIEPFPLFDDASLSSYSLHCLFKDCDTMPFRWQEGLELHYKRKHAPAFQEGAFFCDYKSCVRYNEPFSCEDQLRDHLREFHKEYLDKGWQLGGWWRCRKCLARNCLVKCPLCQLPAPSTHDDDDTCDHSDGLLWSSWPQAEASVSPMEAFVASQTTVPNETTVSQLSDETQQTAEGASYTDVWWQGVANLVSTVSERENAASQKYSPTLLSICNSASDDLESITTEDIPPIHIEEYFTEEFQIEVLQRFLAAFTAWETTKGVKEHGNRSSQKQNSGGSGTNSKLGTHQKPHGQKNDDKGKRKRSDKDENEESDDGRRKRTPKGKSRADSEDDENNLLFACPYYKWKPLTYKSCGEKTLKELHRVKFHLWRAHLPPIYCVICSAEFANADDRDDHYREKSCERGPKKVYEYISPEKEKRLKMRLSQRMTKREQWNEMYTILFPDSPLPKSPYVSTGLLSKDLDALQEFMIQQWPIEYRRFVAPGLPPELAARDDIQEEFSTSLFEQAVERILQRVHQQRENIQSPRSEDSSVASMSSSASEELSSTTNTSELMAPPPPVQQSHVAEHSAVFDLEDMSLFCDPPPLTATISASSSDPYVSRWGEAHSLPIEVEHPSLELDKRPQDRAGFGHDTAFLGTGAGHLPQFDPWALIPDEEYMNISKAGEM